MVALMKDRLPSLLKSRRIATVLLVGGLATIGHEACTEPTDKVTIPGSSVIEGLAGGVCAQLGVIMIAASLRRRPEASKEQPTAQELTATALQILPSNSVVVSRPAHTPTLESVPALVSA